VANAEGTAVLVKLVYFLESHKKKLGFKINITQTVAF
jgi:hypothetical protein